MASQLPPSVDPAIDPELAISDFIQSFYDLISNPSTVSVEWSTAGDELLIHDEQQFTNEILHKHYRATSFASFVRQLNLYGFSKRGTRFTHPNFHRDHPELLHLVRRKGSSAATGTANAMRRRTLGAKKTEKERPIGSRHSSRLQQHTNKDDPSYLEDGSMSDDGAAGGDDSDEYESYQQHHQIGDNDQFPYHVHISNSNPAHRHYNTDTVPPFGNVYGDGDGDDDSDGYPFDVDDDDDLNTTNNTIVIPLNSNNDIQLYPEDFMPVPLPPLQPPLQQPHQQHPLIPAYQSRTTTQTINPHPEGPQVVPLDQYNAAVGALEDQVDLLTQQYHLLYQSQLHVLQLLSRYFAKDIAAGSLGGNTSTGSGDLFSLDPTLVQLASKEISKPIPALKQPDFGVQISVETPQPTPTTGNGPNGNETPRLIVENDIDDEPLFSATSNNIPLNPRTTYNNYPNHTASIPTTTTTTTTTTTATTPIVPSPAHPPHPRTHTTPNTSANPHQHHHYQQNHLQSQSQPQQLTPPWHPTGTATMGTDNATRMMGGAGVPSNLPLTPPMDPMPYGQITSTNINSSNRMGQ